MSDLISRTALLQFMARMHTLFEADKEISPSFAAGYRNAMREVENAPAAAPDLLDALKGMVANACSDCDENYVICCTESEWEAHVAAINRAMSAIAKAEAAA